MPVDTPSSVSILIQSMFCVERNVSTDFWVQEQCFKTEFQAFSNARTKSLNSSGLYRVTYHSESESPSSSNEVLRVSNGKAVLSDSDQLVG